MTLNEIGRALYGMDAFHAQMARDLGVSREWVSGLCSGRHKLSTGLASKLAVLVNQRRCEIKKVELDAK
jgi:plasmid maintenance system antidote protein VapI